MRIGYIGNFGPRHSTENHVAADAERLGHEVVRIQENTVEAWDTGPDGLDVLLWTRTGWDWEAIFGSDGKAEAAHAAQRAMLERFRVAGVPTVGFHLDRWFGLDRQGQVDEEPFFEVDRIWTADGGHPWEWEARNIDHRWSPPAVSSIEADRRGRPVRSFRSDVAFVGSWRGYHPEWAERAELVEWLRSHYGNRCRFWPQGRAVRGRQLADLYASVSVVVGDSCLVPNTRGEPIERYWSDRIPETLGRGGFLLHPYVPGIEDEYEDGEHLRLFEVGNHDEIAALVEHYLAHPGERRRIAEAGREHVRNHHTYRNRIETVLDQLPPVEVPVEETEINGRWTLRLPAHRARRPQWRIENGGWETERLASMHDTLTALDGEDDPVVFDIGAEEGDMPALFASWGCDVVLVEPNRRVWPNMRLIFEENDLNDPLACFVGFAADEDDGTEPEVGWPDCADGRVIGDHGFLNLSERPDVARTTIDRLATTVRRPDAITIDVEGAELRVLRGAAGTLRLDRPLLWISVHPAFMVEMYGDHDHDLHRFLADLGYVGRLLAVDHEHHWFYVPTEALR